MSKIFEKKRGIPLSSFLFLCWGGYFLWQLFAWGGLEKLLPLYVFMLLALAWWKVRIFLTLSKKELRFFLVALLFATLVIGAGLAVYGLMGYSDIPQYGSWLLEHRFFQVLFTKGICRSQACFFELLFMLFYTSGGVLVLWISFLMVIFKKRKKA